MPIPIVAYGVAALLAGLVLGASQTGCVSAQKLIDAHHARNPRPRWLTEKEDGYEVGDSGCRDVSYVPSHIREQDQYVESVTLSGFMDKLRCSKGNFYTLGRRPNYWEPCALDNGGIGERFYVRYLLSDFECTEQSTMEIQERAIPGGKERTIRW